MKNQTTRHERPNRPAPPRAHPTLPTPDPLERHAQERRLYTDFLALAFYPGMRPVATGHDRPHAA